MSAFGESCNGQEATVKGIQTVSTRRGCSRILAGRQTPAGRAGSWQQYVGDGTLRSPTVMSVGSLDLTLTPSAFSPIGKIDIVGPGRDILSSWSRPVRYKTISGLATAGAHVVGCAALCAQHSPSLRGIDLWNALQRSAKSLPFPATRIGAGLVSGAVERLSH